MASDHANVLNSRETRCAYRGKQIALDNVKRIGCLKNIMNRQKRAKLNKALRSAKAASARAAKQYDQSAISEKEFWEVLDAEEAILIELG